jgi:hypothetical protein
MNQPRITSAAPAAEFANGPSFWQRKSPWWKLGWVIALAGSIYTLLSIGRQIETSQLQTGRHYYDWIAVGVAVVVGGVVLMAVGHRREQPTGPRPA